MPFKLPEPEVEFVIPEPEEKTFQLRPGVSTVIRSQSLFPERKRPIPPPSTATALGVAGGAAGESLINILRRTANIAATGGGGVLGLNVEPPFQEEFELQSIAEALRETQTLPQNIAAGALGVAPFLAPGLGQALFAADVATQPEKIPEQLGAIGQTFKDVRALADPLIQAGPLKTIFGEKPEAERVEAKRRFRTHPVESAFNIALPASVFVGGIKGAAKIGKKFVDAKVSQKLPGQFKPEVEVKPAIIGKGKVGEQILIEKGLEVAKPKPEPVVPPLIKTKAAPGEIAKPIPEIKKGFAKGERPTIPEKIEVPKRELPPKPPPIPKVEIRPAITGIGKKGEPIAFEAPRPKVPPKPAVPPPAGKTLGLSKEENRKLRSDFKVEALDPVQRQAIETAWGEAKAEGFDLKALDVASEVIKNPRPVSTKEHAGMSLKASQLANEYENIIKFRDERIKVGDKRGASAETVKAEVVLEQIDRLTQGADLGGTETGRALRIRGILVNRETFDLARVTQRARAVKGAPLSPRETAKVEGAVKRHKELESKIKELEAKNDQILAEQDRIIAERMTKREARKIVSRKKKQGIAAERKEIKKAIADLGFRVNDITGLTAEGSYQVGRLAVNYIKEGARTLEDVVAKVTSDVPDLKPRDVHQAINARDPKLQAKARTATQKRITGLKTQAKLTEELTLIGEGIWGTPKKRPSQAIAIQKLQKRISDLRRQRDLVGEVEAGKRGVFKKVKARTKRVLEIERLEKELRDLKTEDRLTKEIVQAEKGIFKKSKTRTDQIQSIKRLQKRLNELKAEALKSTKEGDRLQAINMKISELQDQLHNQMRSIKKKQKPEPAVIAEAKTKLRELRSLIRIEDELAGLNEQMRTGVFEVPKEVIPKRESVELQRRRIDLQIARKNIRGLIESRAPLVKKRFPFVTGKGAREAINIARTIKATADMSYLLRQGAVLAPRRPVAAAKAFKGSVEAFFSRHKAEEIDAAIRAAPHHYIREKAKLYLAPIGEGAKISAREELFMSGLIERFPRWTVIGPVVRASNRNMATGLNMLRVSAFDQFLQKYPNATQVELRAWADWINNATGRGNLRTNAAWSNFLSTVFFAPRFAASRIETPLTIFKKMSKRTRKEVAYDMVAAASIGGTVLALSAAAGLEVGLDPSKSNFGKIEYGNTKIDIWAGLQQPARVVTRIGMRVSGLEDRADPLDLITRFMIFKIAPAIAIPKELITGRTVVGEPRRVEETAAEALLPIVFQDVLEAWRLDGAEAAALSGGLGFFGVGTSTFRDKRRKHRPVPPSGKAK